MIYQICDAMMSISKDNFQDFLNNLEDWGYVPGTFQFSNLFQLLNNQLRQVPVLHFFWKSK